MLPCHSVFCCFYWFFKLLVGQGLCALPDNGCIHLHLYVSCGSIRFPYFVEPISHHWSKTNVPFYIAVIQHFLLQCFPGQWIQALVLSFTIYLCLKALVSFSNGHHFHLLLVDIHYLVNKLFQEFCHRLLSCTSILHSDAQNLEFKTCFK